MPGNDPRKHHFQPKQAVLKNFVDQSGMLHFWRRGANMTTALPGSPDKLFRINDLNATIDDDGRRDVSVELFLGQVDGRSARLIEKVLKQVRKGRPPLLDTLDWRDWCEFVYYLFLRSPVIAAGLMADVGMDGSIEKLLDVYERDNGKLPAQERQAVLQDPNSRNLWRNIMVQARARAPKKDVVETFNKLGIVVFKAPPGSFLVGECPVVSVALGEDPHRRSVVIPVAHDAAFGASSEPMTASLNVITESQADIVNRAVVKHSMMFAGRTARRVEGYRQVEFVPWSPAATVQQTA